MGEVTIEPSKSGRQTANIYNNPENYSKGS
jgi:hypothetical protein